MTMTMTMTTEYISIADTAKLVRQSMKEAFPGLKFGVRSKSWSLGGAVYVSWTDGPNATQVEAVAGRFAGSYFDAGIDYKGSVSHMLDGRRVRFCADSVHCMVTIPMNRCNAPSIALRATSRGICAMRPWQSQRSPSTVQARSSLSRCLAWAQACITRSVARSPRTWRRPLNAFE